MPGYPLPPRPMTAQRLVEAAGELGVRVVQIADNLPLDRLSPAELDNLVHVAAENKVELEVGTCGIQAEHLAMYLKLAIRLGSPLVRLVMDTSTSHPSPDEIVASLGRVIPAYSEAGVMLALENHDRFPAAALAAIVRRLESTHVGVCLDTANSLGCGEDLRTVLSALRPWIVNVHWKDFSVRRLPHQKGFAVEGCPAGQGLVDTQGLLDELTNIRRDLSVILELWPQPEEAIEKSIAKEERWTRQSVAFLRQYISE
jgi:sugar phosphate isomerase/epimerase